MQNTVCQAALAIAVLLTIVPVETSAGDIKFKRTQIEGKFRSEGAAIGDLNNDGKADISAGSVYFAAPDWKMHVIADEPHEFDPANYSDTFCNFIDDVNGDGWNDVLVVDFPGKETWWFENPQTTGGKWKRHAAVPVTNNESPNMLDIDGDGRRELIFSDGENRLAYAKPTADPAAPWKITPISKPNAPGTQKFSHGLGVGDVNGDGRLDILSNEGWWEAPAELGQGEWDFHAAPFGQPCANMYAYDFDGDGDNDILSSSAHAYGIWWHEQTPEGWKTHEIDKSFSQTHSLWLADINGDGLQDFVTGKRWWAHGASGDPGSDQPAVMFWFELQRENGKPKWIAHQFDHDSGVGTQFDVGDINGDGLLDVATSNKKGTNVFLQVRE